jgi:hypothetical protein
LTGDFPLDRINGIGTLGSGIVVIKSFQVFLELKGGVELYKTRANVSRREENTSGVGQLLVTDLRKRN